MQIYHNPRCAKSRETLELLKSHGKTPEIILYLDQIPSKNELKSILKKLNISAEQLVRKGEKIYKEKFSSKQYSEAEWIEIMVNNPKLIERPIVIENEKAIIGRPPENVLSLI